MKKIAFIISFIVISLSASPLDELLNEVNADSAKQMKEDKAREASFLSDLNKAKALLKESKDALTKEKAKTASLKSEFEKNRRSLQELSLALDKKSANLKELFAISQQESRDFSSLVKSSMTSSEIKGRDIFLDDLATSHAIPTIDTLRKFWKLYLEEIIESGKVVQVQTSLINTQGEQSQQEITRLGLFSAFDKSEYIRYDDALQEFVKLIRQPDSKYLSYIPEYENSSSEITPILIDPTRGVLFSMLKERATLSERVEQGGVIGYIILALGALTLLYALFKYVTLSRVNAKMKHQMISDEVKTDNPLGRILSAFEKHKDKSIDTIESKMDTAILKELPEIQSGLPMIKLVAAVAPLLGLLGTVTGMIETFQSITLFGTGDPKLMAGGISQALMTTVLGLVVAIPVLFIYNIVHAKSKKLIEILTQQSSVLVAKQLEMLHVSSDEYRKNI